MLINFKVANYRSFRDEQEFSLVASNADKEHPECLIDRELPGLAGIRLLKGAALYGANASGKSNLVDAIRFLKEFVESSATGIKPGDPTGTVPFKLDRESPGKPSRFEITFVADGVRYLFGLSLTSARVIEEFLVAYPKGRPQRWYHRTWNEAANAYDWAPPSSEFEDDGSLHDKTRPNALFLSVGPQFNHAQLAKVLSWFRERLMVIDLCSLPRRADEGVYRYYQIATKLLENSDHREAVLSFLAKADLGIVDGRVENEEVDAIDLSRIDSLDESDLSLLKRLMPKQRRISLSHKVDEDLSPVWLDFNSEESAGTRRFLALIIAWLSMMSQSRVAFIDEIESSLHPLLVRELVNLLFCDAPVSAHPQFVFTTHSPVLLDTTLVRRDQIWFTEKDQSGATHLYPLTDFSPRKDEALQKGYLAGRYGGIPFIPHGLK